MMSAKVKKFNKYQIGQGRNFVITNVNLYNFNVKSKYLINLPYIKITTCSKITCKYPK